MVVEDLKRLAAMNKAGSKAQEFIAMATKTDGQCHWQVQRPLQQE